MSLFRNENPNLGPQTTVQELSGTGAGNPVANNYKPTTRQIIETSLDAVRNTSGQLTGWLFRAPWACQVVAAWIVTEANASTSVTLDAYKVPVASQPEAPSSGTALFAAAINLDTGVTANTPLSVALTTASGSPLVLAAGDLIGYNLSTAPTGLVGGLLQIEVVQIG